MNLKRLIDILCILTKEDRSKYKNALSYLQDRYYDKWFDIAIKNQIGFNASNDVLEIISGKYADIELIGIMSGDNNHYLHSIMSLSKLLLKMNDSIERTICNGDERLLDALSMHKYTYAIGIMHLISISETGLPEKFLDNKYASRISEVLRARDIPLINYYSPGKGGDDLMIYPEYNKLYKFLLEVNSYENISKDQLYIFLNLVSFNASRTKMLERYSANSIRDALKNVSRKMYRYINWVSGILNENEKLSAIFDSKVCSVYKRAGIETFKDFKSMIYKHNGVYGMVDAVDGIGIYNTELVLSNNAVLKIKGMMDIFESYRDVKVLMACTDDGRIDCESVILKRKLRGQL